MDRPSIVKFRATMYRLAAAICAALCGIAMASCAEPPAPPRASLKVATRNSPTTYYEDRQGYLAGLEYDLVEEFARDHRLEVEFVVLDSIGEILDAVSQGEVDLAAAGLTKTAARAEDFLIGPVYQEIEEQVVCHPGARVRGVEDLADKSIRVIADSSYQETLAGLHRRNAQLAWESTDEESTEQLLQLVSEGALDCTVADSNIVALSRSLLPDLGHPFALGDSEHLAWFVSESSGDLVEPLEVWFGEMKRSGRLRSLLNRYYWRARTVDAGEHYATSVFFRRVQRRLPLFEEMFVDVETSTSVDWRLLAAVSYQESHWDPEAVSTTGVRGLMMLTEATAEELGVDRLDPYESILGGAKYLDDLINRIPSFVPEPDRSLLGLAAYNIGYSHLEDARKLAVELGQDPNSWASVREVLPLLSQPKYYRTLRHGYARGNEPVIFVKQVRTYYELLSQSFSRVRADRMPEGILVSSMSFPPPIRP